jgi:polysaccharide pyruvyl transferase WcaK-like protein
VFRPPAGTVRRYLAAARRRVTDPLAYLPMPARRATSDPTVGLVGFYGWGNYGDELFREVFEQQLGDAMHLRTVLNPAPGRLRGRQLGPAVRASDALVIGGGDIVIPWSTSSRYWERVYVRRPVFVAGVGVPTFRAPAPHAVERLRTFFQHPSVRSIGARDSSSAEWIRQNLQPSAPVVTTPDLVCALRLPDVNRPSDPPIFGIAVRRRAKPDDLTHVRRLGERAQALGYRLRLLVLATGPTRARDLEATRDLGFADSELISTDSLDAITRAIGECTAMASMKFHGSLVGAMYGVPSFVLMPTAKNRYFMDDIGRRDLVAVYNDPDLPDRLTRDPEPIAATTRDRLRAGAETYLADLRRQILDVAAGR